MVGFEGDAETLTPPLPPKGELPPPQAESMRHARSKPKNFFRRELEPLLSNAAGKKTPKGAGGQVTSDIPNASVKARSN
jgi:hypothetical protein